MAQKKIKTFKDIFIAEQGAGMYNLLKLYWNGNRSVECVEAVRIYGHYSKGLNGNIWTIYTISEGNKIVYVGRTGKTLAARWTHHKSNARTSADTQPLHLAMMTTTDTATFPEWHCHEYVKTDDKNAAIELERLAIVALKTNINGYNCKIGGGNTSKKHLKNDAILDIVKAGYPL